MGVSSETEPPSRTGKSKHLYGFPLLETTVLLAMFLLKLVSAPNRTASACFGISPRYKWKHVLFTVPLFHPVLSSSGQSGEFLLLLLQEKKRRSIDTAIYITAHSSHLEVYEAEKNVCCPSLIKTSRGKNFSLHEAILPSV